MAEASLKTTLNNKKRRVEGGAGSKSKKAMQSLTSESMNALNSITDLTLSGPGPVPSTSSSNNTVIKKTYHLGVPNISVGIGARSFNIDRSSHRTADIDTYYQHFNIESTYKKQTKIK